MSICKGNALIAFGLIAGLHLTAAQAQGEHDGHHPDSAPSTQTRHLTQQHGEMMDHDGMGHEGMDHDTMMQMHEQHMGKGQMQRNKPDGSDKGLQHVH